MLVSRAEEAFPIARFLSVEAIVYLLKAVPWHIPDFSVDHYFGQLRDLDVEMCSMGAVDVTTHRFLLVAQNAA